MASTLVARGVIARIVALCAALCVAPCIGGPALAADGGIVDGIAQPVDAPDGGPSDAGPSDAGPAADAAIAPPTAVLGSSSSDAEVEARRSEVVGALEALPAAVADAPDALADRRASLKARLALLDEILAGRLAQRRTDAELARLPTRLRALEAEARALDARGEFSLPDTVDEAVLEEVEGRAETLRTALQSLEAERAEAERRLDALPGEIQKQRSRTQAAAVRVDDLQGRLRSAIGDDERDGILTELEQARLEGLAAETVIRRFERELRLLREGEVLLGRRIELARRRLRDQEQVVEQVRDRIVSQLRAQGEGVRQALADAREALEAAEGQTARFLARGRVLLVESEAQTADAARLRVVLDRNLTHQRKLLGAEQAELQGISRLVERDTSGRAAQTLKDAFQRLDRRFLELRQAREVEGLERLSDLRTRRLEVAAHIYALDDRWQLSIDALPTAEARRDARNLRESLRVALRAEQDVIADALASGESLLAVLGDRDGVLESLDALVRARIFWVQDRPPIGRRMIDDARQETVRLGLLAVADATWARVDRADAWPPGILLLVGTVGSLVLLLAWWRMRRWLAALWPRRVAQVERMRARRAREEAAAEAQMVAEARLATEAAEREVGETEAAEAAERARAAASAARAAEARATAADREAEQIAADEQAGGDADPQAAPGPAPGEPPGPASGSPPGGEAEPSLSGWLLFAVGAAAVCLLPAWCYGMARLIEWAPISDTLRGPLAAGFDVLALLTLLMLGSRLVLRTDGLASVELGVAVDTTAALRRASRTGLLIALPTVVLHAEMSADPLRLEALPRLCYTVMEIAVLLLLLRLLRPRSPVVRDLVGRAGDLPLRLLGLAWGALAVFGLVVVGMDLGGYRYGANWLAGNALGSLAVSGAALLAWPPVQEQVAPVLAGLIDNGETLRARALFRARRVLRAAFVLLGVLVLAFIWDIDSRALNFLDAVTLYTMGAGEEATAVTLADLARVVFTGVVIAGLLRWLPGIFGLTLFRYVDVEAGARYAIVTIARYVTFFMGVVVALDALHIDLGQLSWLVAAVGVGLGFGLQEIVANFVSGIILLMERPIRIGDWVTIGSIEGTVQRIQIRATTLLTLDRQEIIVPNKDFITREVVNWTHQDRMVRLSVPIGVAYGTDVERVRQLLLDVARQNPDVLADPKPNALLMAHGDSSLDFELRVHHLDPTRQAPLRGALNAAINRALAEAHIEIPFPQRDLHLRSGWPPSSGD